MQINQGEHTILKVSSKEKHLSLILDEIIAGKKWDDAEAKNISTQANCLTCCLLNLISKGNEIDLFNCSKHKNQTVLHTKTFILVKNCFNIVCLIVFTSDKKQFSISSHIFALQFEHSLPVAIQKSIKDVQNHCALPLRVLLVVQRRSCPLSRSWL